MPFCDTLIVYNYYEVRKMKKVMLRSALVVVLVLLLCFVIAGVHNKTADPLFDNIVSGESIDAKASERSFNVLLVGLDNSKQLADAIMLVNVNKSSGKISMLSIPRDTKVHDGSGYRKINSCYSQSMDELIDQVKRLTGVYVNYYAVICPGVLATVVDALGGVEIDVMQDMKYSDPAQDLSIDLKKGRQVLDGMQAEQYCRYRNYVMGDLDRTKAQQNFFTALFEQKLDIKYVTKVNELFKSLDGKIFTNITFADIMENVDLMGMLKDSDSVVSYDTPGEYNDMQKEGVSYFIIENDHIRELRNICNEHFCLK